MKPPLGSLPAPNWRAEGSPQLPLRAPGGKTSRRFAFLLAGWLVCLLGIGALLALIQPGPSPHFLPLVVTEYDSPTLIAPAASRRDGEQLCKLFDEVATPTWTSPSRADMLRRLADLTAPEDAVVYLSAHALVAATGEVAILPADAVPDDPRTWLPLTEILLRLKRSPSRRQLLILDIMHSGLVNRWGAPPGEVARALPAALAAVPDERRLTLTACAPGQAAQTAEVAGQSIFASYLAEGIRGRADGCGVSGRRDGRVNVHELAAFVQARVDRWARLNRGVGQTPMLFGNGADFALATVMEPSPPRVREPMPTWLQPARIAAAKMLDDGRFRRNPRAWLQISDLIGATENAWRSDADAGVQSHFLQRFDQLRELFPPTEFPAVFTLTLAGEPTSSNAPLQELLAQTYEQCRQAKPDEVARIQARFLAQWPLATRPLPPKDRDAAVLSWLTKSPHDPANIRWADALLRSGSDVEPRWGESLAVRLLADLASGIPATAWSNTQAQQVLALAHRAERSLRHSEIFAWFQENLDQAYQAKHEGEIALWSHGFVPQERAGQFLALAEKRFLELNDQVERFAAAVELADRATVLLPGYRPVLDVQPHRLATWNEAIRQAAALLDLRIAPPGGAISRHALLASIDQHAGQLRQALQSLREPFLPERIERLLQTGPADNTPARLKEMEALRDAGAGWLAETVRGDFVKATASLAKQLHEAAIALDRADDARGTNNEPFGSATEPTDLLAQAARTASCELALLELGGVSQQLGQGVREACVKLSAVPGDAAAWSSFGQAMRDLHALHIPAFLARESSLVRKERLSRVVPVREAFAAFDGGVPIAVQACLQEKQRAWTWLADRYRYQARDYAGLGLDTPGIAAARSFFADAAAHAVLAPESHILVRHPPAVDRLHSGKVAATTILSLERVVPVGQQGPTLLQVVPPDAAWLLVTPAAIELPGVKNSGPTQTLATQAPLRIELRDGAERSQTPAPHGFLAVARADGRAYHRLVPVPLRATPQEIAVIVSSNPNAPEPNLEEVRLRPGNVRQAFFVYLENLSERPRNVTVELSAGGGLMPGGKARVRLRPGQRERVVFSDSPPPQDSKPLPECHGPLEVRVFDAERNQAPLAVRRIPIVVALPREYVRIAAAQVESAPSGASGRVSVSLQTLQKVPGPGIPAQLVLPARRSANLPDLSPLRELPSQASSEPVALFAATARHAGSDEERPIYVTVDGVPRAFIFRTASGQRGAAATQRDERLSVRIRAASSSQPSQRVPVTIEVDNAPSGARIEFQVTRTDGAMDLVRRCGTAQQQRIGVSPLGPDGALVFEAAIQDWTLSLDASGWIGRRVLKARLLDEQGTELQHSVHELVVDATPPEEVAFIAPPAQAQRGTALKLVARGFDRESDIAQVFFFLGKSIEERIPPDTPAVSGIAADIDRGLWGAALNLPPDRTGPMTVSVQFVNRAGLARCAIATVEVLDVDPATLRPGGIAGKVLEGPRPQPGLTVILRDEQGNDLKKTRTQPDGTFQFDVVPPGRYQLFSHKPESGRRALQPVTVPAGGMQRVNLALSL